VIEKERYDYDLMAFLRNPLDYPPRMTIEVFNEAADEIERLRMSNMVLVERLQSLAENAPATPRLRVVNPHSNSPPSDGSKE
jgi:hypothetical protein